MVMMSTSVCALAKTVTCPPLPTLEVFHTTTIYERLDQRNDRQVAGSLSHAF